ncbi:MAG: hypothetical protein H6733_10920 [Alphaproteobacteria bacterium]|nr:hypothetical protein [Alphaproteobacteria bacterium]
MRIHGVVSVAMIALAACRAEPAKDAVDSDTTDLPDSDSDGVDTDVDDTDGVDTDTHDTDHTDTEDTPDPASVRLWPSVSYPDEPLWWEAAQALAEASATLEGVLTTLDDARAAWTTPGVEPCPAGVIGWRDGAAMTDVDALFDPVGDGIVLLCPGRVSVSMTVPEGRRWYLGPMVVGSLPTVGADAGGFLVARDAVFAMAGLRVDEALALGDYGSRVWLVDLVVRSGNAGLVSSLGAELILARSTMEPATSRTLQGTIGRVVVAQNRWLPGSVSARGGLDLASPVIGGGLTVLSDNVWEEMATTSSVVRWLGRAPCHFASIGNQWQGLRADEVLELAGFNVRVGLFADRFDRGEGSAAAAIGVSSSGQVDLRMVDVDVVGSRSQGAAVRLGHGELWTSTASWLRGNVARNLTVDPAVSVAEHWAVRFEDVAFGSGTDANAGGDVTWCPPLATWGPVVEVGDRDCR